MIKYLQYICYIIQKFMDLDDKHIYIYNNKWIIPDDRGLCVVVGCDNITPISNGKDHIYENNIFKERFFINNIAEITINIFSYNQDAINRKDEVLMALNSDEFLNLQSKYGFSIGNLPTSFLQHSEKEGVKILNKFILNFNLFYQSRKEQETLYYDNFNNINLITNN